MKLMSGLIVWVFLFSFSAAGQTTIGFMGNSLIISKGDSTTVMDPITGQPSAGYVAGIPMSLNGEKIYDNRQLSVHPEYENPRGNKMKLASYIFLTVKKKLELLDDGSYLLEIDNPVIDKHGRLVFYQFEGIKQIMLQADTSKYATTRLNDCSTWQLMNSIVDDKNIQLNVKNDINASVAALLNQYPTVKSGQYNGAAVNTTGYLFSGGSIIVVKHHAARLEDDYFSL